MGEPSADSWQGPTIKMSGMTQPVAFVRFEGRATDDEFGDYLRAQNRMMQGRLDRHEQCVLVLDAIDSGGAPPSQRKMQAEWLKANEHTIQQCSLGMAFVIRSPIVRGVMTAVLWLSRLPVPHKVTATVADAKTWAEQRLAEASQG